MSSLPDFKIAVLGSEESSVRSLTDALRAEGASIRCLGSDPSTEVDIAEVDALLLAADTEVAAALASSPTAQRLLRAAVENNRPMAVIGHGAAILAAAGFVASRMLAGPQDVQDQIVDSGGSWVADPVWVDRNWVTASRLSAPALIDTVLKVFAIAAEGSRIEPVPASS